MNAPRAASDGTVSVAELLEVREFGLRLLAGGPRTAEPLRWAHSTELLHPGEYLRGGELVLTVGTSLSSDAACQTFVDDLVASEVRALGFGVGDVHDAVPDALVRACRAVGMPLIEVRRGMPFLAITELLADRRAQAREAHSRRTQQLVADLLDALSDDASLDAVLTIAAQRLGGQLQLVSGQGDVVAASPEAGEVGGEPLAVTLPDGSQVFWFIGEADDLDGDPEALRQLGHVIGLKQHEHDVERSRHRADRGRLLQLVVDGRADLEVLDDLLADHGVDASSLTVLAVPRAAAPLAEASLRPGLVTELGNCAVVLISDVSAAEGFAQNSGVPCGMAESAPASGLRHAVPEALAALALSRHRGTPARAADLTSFDGLLEQQAPERLQPFALQLIAPLAAHDEQHGTALLSTLRTFLEGDGAVNATARLLFLHPNSLRHRLGRISDLSGRNPLHFHDRVALAVGLWAWDRRGLGRAAKRRDPAART